MPYFPWHNEVENNSPNSRKNVDPLIRRRFYAPFPPTSTITPRGKQFTKENIQALAGMIAKLATQWGATDKSGVVLCAVLWDRMEGWALRQSKSWNQLTAPQQFWGQRIEEINNLKNNHSEAYVRDKQVCFMMTIMERMNYTGLHYEALFQTPDYPDGPVCVLGFRRHHPQYQTAGVSHKFTRSAVLPYGQ